jgi:hypothetical protein
LDRAYNPKVSKELSAAHNLISRPYQRLRVRIPARKARRLPTIFARFLSFPLLFAHYILWHSKRLTAGCPVSITSRFLICSFLLDCAQRDRDFAITTKQALNHNARYFDLGFC